MQLAEDDERSTFAVARDLCGVVIDIARKDPAHLQWGKAYYEARGDMQAGPAVQPLEDACRDWVRQWVERGQSRGDLRDDTSVTILVDLLMGMGFAVDRWALSLWDPTDARSTERMVQVCDDLLRRVLGNHSTEAGLAEPDAVDMSWD